MGKIAVSALADNDLGTYSSAQEAAVAALRSIKGDKHVETGGAILYNPTTQKWAYTQPVGQLQDAHFAANIQMPQGWQLHGLYHTHPVGQQSTQFSQDDVDMANRLKVPSYILARADDKVRSFTPGASQVVQSAGTYFSPGSVVDEPSNVETH